MAKKLKRIVLGEATMTVDEDCPEGHRAEFETENDTTYMRTYLIDAVDLGHGRKKARLVLEVLE